MFEYVEKRMTEAQEHEDRAQSRELEKMRMELEKLAMEKQPRESARAQEFRLEDTEEDGSNNNCAITIAQYITVFVSLKWLHGLALQKVLSIRMAFCRVF